MWRTTIITSEVDPSTGGGMPGTGGVMIIESVRCPQTCFGSRVRFVTLEGVTNWLPCTHCRF